MQKTGVAIETQGFTFVTSGRKRESLMVSYVIFEIRLRGLYAWTRFQV